jgi:hypothetical protein
MPSLHQFCKIQVFFTFSASIKKKTWKVGYCSQSFRGHLCCKWRPSVFASAYFCQNPRRWQTCKFILLNSNISSVSIILEFSFEAFLSRICCICIIFFVLDNEQYGWISISNGKRYWNANLCLIFSLVLLSLSIIWDCSLLCLNNRLFI